MLQLFVISTFIICIAYAVHLPEANMTTPQIIKLYGYPAEVHTVTTEDGYILELHRIPFGRNATNRDPSSPRAVVFLQHGFIGSSAVWVTNLPEKSAGFLFADAGFDVWMGNVRGNTYSTRHVKYTRKNKKYWAFTWDEMSKFDLDAMINYALNHTRRDSLYYVGYSEGTLTMFAKLASDQNFSRKIRLFFALGPIGSVAHIQGLIETAAKKFFQPLEVLPKIAPEFMPNDSLFRRMSKATCSVKRVTSHCENLMFQMTGPPTSQMNQTRIPVYMTHLPAGTSTANLLHWAQMVNSGLVQMFDYGTVNANLRHYNSSVPPVYDLSLVNAPTYLYWSDADWLADKTDIEESLIGVIPSKYLVKSVQLPNFNHFDFIWGINAARLIYQPIIDIIDDHQTVIILD